MAFFPKPIFICIEDNGVGKNHHTQRNRERNRNISDNHELRWRWHEITSVSNFWRISSIAFITSRSGPEIMRIRSEVPGKNSWLRDNWIRAPDCDWKSMIVDPPFPIIHPASEFDTRNLICVDLSLSSEKISILVNTFTGNEDSAC